MNKPRIARQFPAKHKFSQKNMDHLIETWSVLKWRSVGGKRKYYMEKFGIDWETIKRHYILPARNQGLIVDKRPRRRKEEHDRIGENIFLLASLGKGKIEVSRILGISERHDAMLDDFWERGRSSGLLTIAESLKKEIEEGNDKLLVKLANTQFKEWFNDQLDLRRDLDREGIDFSDLTIKLSPPDESDSSKPPSSSDISSIDDGKGDN